MAPKVLVSDKLSETAVQIFIDRGIEVDFMPDLGKDKEALANAIGNYDGLAIVPFMPSDASKRDPLIPRSSHCFCRGFCNSKWFSNRVKW